MANNILSITIGIETPTTKHDHLAAVRCIITKDDQICIIYVMKGNYSKLPGGGVEPEDENDTVAAKREALEETGGEVTVMPDMIAKTLEYRGDLKQQSHAYICTVTTDTGKVELTELEADEGLSHQWCSLNGALDKINSVKPTSELGRFIKKRDTFLLECYRELLDVI